MKEERQTNHEQFETVSLPAAPGEGRPLSLLRLGSFLHDHNIRQFDLRPASRFMLWGA